MPVPAPAPTDAIPTEHLTRTAGAVGLLALAVIHVIDLPGTVDETPLIGYGYLALIIVAVLAAAALITLPGRRVWGLAGMIAAGALVAYVLSRTSGLPTDSDDIGNWRCSLGIAALSVEAVIMLLAAWQMTSSQPRLGSPAARDGSGQPQLATVSGETR